MHYSRSVEFRGDAGKAFDLAAAALAGVGFRIDGRTDSSLEATGPGMTSSRQSPLVGASRIQFARRGGELTADAELGGARWVGRFATLFPLGLCLFLCVVLTAVFWGCSGGPRWLTSRPG